MSKGTEGKKDSHEVQQHSPKPETHGSKGKQQPQGMVGGCTAWSCKKESEQFGFCPEHYDHFKFGLIKKTGEQVPDYEKKFEHYQAYVAKRKAQKVA